MRDTNCIRVNVSRIRRLAVWLLAAIALFSLSGVRELRAAQDEAPTEPEVKAAMIYNFAQFVEWPEGDVKSSPSPFVIGVFGDDPITSILEETVKGESFQNRAIQVRHLFTLNDVRMCDILFVSQSQKKRIPEILDTIRGSSTLTIGDTEDFVPLGGMIAFKKEGNRVRFQINPDAAMRAGLKISSKLLRLAILQNDGAAKGRG